MFKTHLTDELVRFYIIILPEKLELLSVVREDFKQWHSRHWGIEGYHRALKQLCGIGNFFVRKPRAILNHFFCSIRGFIKLELMKQNKLIDSWYEPQRNLYVEITREFILHNINLEIS